MVEMGVSGHNALSLPEASMESVGPSSVMEVILLSSSKGDIAGQISNRKYRPTTGSSTGELYPWSISRPIRTSCPLLHWGFRQSSFNECPSVSGCPAAISSW